MTSKLKTHFKHFMIGSLIAALGASAYVIAAVTFSDFTTGTTISAADMNTKLNALRDEVNVIEPVRTRLQYSGQNDFVPSTLNYALVRTVGTFTKVAAGTNIELTWIAHVRTVGGFCSFQLRIDGIKDTGSILAAFEPTEGGTATVYGADSPVAVTAWFPGLPAGVHSVEIWVRSVAASSCTLNPQNFGQTVLVKEAL
ncbi:MAG TPA: hypothetical protein VK138_08590 [Acidiferrobacterales bacterium]|nr:hypothetical protein [Acidiferrobacterales bacterium]